MQPGMFSGTAAGSLSGTAEDNELLVNAIKNDAQAINYTFVSVGDVNGQPVGTWKVALVVNPDIGDFHWFRVDSNGYWSHKQGELPVGEQITDPKQIAVQNNYSVFVGYFYVGPNSDMSLITR